MGEQDSQRFARAFEAHGPSVLAYLRRRSDPSTAEDVLSETFLTAWRRRGEVDDPTLPWLYGIAHKLLANAQRAAGNRVALAQRLQAAGRASAPAEPELAAGEPVLSSALRRALLALSDADREVVLLDAWEQLTREEAAQVLGCRPATYGVRLHRARGRLRAALEQDPGAQPAARGEHGATSIGRPERGDA